MAVEISDVKIDGGEADGLDAARDEAVVEQAAEQEAAALLSSDAVTDEQRQALIDEFFPLPDGFPSHEQLEEWERRYGRIRIRRVAAHDAYVVRPLMRSEMKKHLDELKRMFAGADVTEAELELAQEDLLVATCTLWPELTLADIRGETTPVKRVAIAGTASLLAFDIREISNLSESGIGPFEEL